MAAAKLEDVVAALAVVTARLDVMLASMAGVAAALVLANGERAAKLNAVVEALTNANEVLITATRRRRGGG